MDNYEERKLSPEERELNVFLKEEREEQIKKTLEKFREKERDEIWGGKKFNSLYADNIFKNGKELFKGGKNIFGEKATLFKQPNIFKMK